MGLGRYVCMLSLTTFTKILMDFFYTILLFQNFCKILSLSVTLIVRITWNVVRSSVNWMEACWNLEKWVQILCKSLEFFKKSCCLYGEELGSMLGFF